MSERPKFVAIDSEDVSYKLPIAHSREIGRVIVRWAFFEDYIQRMVSAIAFMAGKASIPLGRIAAREPKFPDRLRMLEHLAGIRNINLDKTLIQTMKTKSRLLVEKRNLLAHGIWTHVPGVGWVVQQTTGAWDEIEGGPKGSKRIKPEAVLMSVNDIRDVVNDIDDLIEDTKKLHYLMPGSPYASP